jgi:peptidoglycan/xylan/chitin deacetylase (PgdA/CDA1 family)
MASVKHLGKKLVSFATRREISWLFEHLFADNPTIFMLHRFQDQERGIRGHSPEFVRNALSFLRRERYRIVSVKEIFDSLSNGERIPSRTVAFTMDDGYEDQVSVGLPIFAEFDCPVTCFVITGFLDGLLWPWDARIDYVTQRTKKNVLAAVIDGRQLEYPVRNDEQRVQAKRHLTEYLKRKAIDEIDDAISGLAEAAEVDVPGSPPAGYSSLTWDNARQASCRGFSFGPHTVSHAPLSRLCTQRAAQEISQSRARVAQEIGESVEVFCYPIGKQEDFGDRETMILDRERFAGAVTAVGGCVSGRACRESADARFRVPRFGFPVNHINLVQYVSWIERAKQKLLGQRELG